MPSDRIELIDHTSLTGNETAADIEKLCREARGSQGEPQAAAVCVHVQWVRLARLHLQRRNIKVATVINFWEGNDDAETVRRETRAAIDAGAQEIDLVHPAFARLAVDFTNGVMMRIIWAVCLRECAGPGVTTKLILETAAWDDMQALEDTAYKALEAGFDFLKTSTGKHSQGGATPAAVAALIPAVNRFEQVTGKKRGIKISGGVRTPEQAEVFLDQLREAGIPITPERVRLGSSGLLQQLRAGAGDATCGAGSY